MSPPILPVTVEQAREELARDIQSLAEPRSGTQRVFFQQRALAHLDALILGVRAEQQETLDRLTKERDEWCQQANEVLAERKQAEQQLAAAQAANRLLDEEDAVLIINTRATVIAQVKALIGDLRAREIDGLKNAAYFDALQHVSEELNALQHDPSLAVPSEADREQAVFLLLASGRIEGDPMTADLAQKSQAEARRLLHLPAPPVEEQP